MMYQYNFLIADILFSLHIDHVIKVTESFLPFTYEGSKNEQIDIWIRTSSDLLKCNGETCFESIVFRVYEERGKYVRVYYNHLNQDKDYAVSRIIDKSKEDIFYIKDGKCFFDESHNTFSHIAFEELLVEYSAMMLHAAFIKCEYGGILFAGSSGVGKSTQAELWRYYKNAKIINGDKTILRKKGQKWKAYGSPYAGSSRYFVNEFCDIRAIILLKKGKKCELKKLSSSVEIFQKLYPHIIINTWNEAYVKRISELLEEIMKNVGVYQFTCTPDKKAVDILCDSLTGDEK